MPTSLTPYLHVGQTPAQSCANLHSWLDSIACSLAGQQCLVKTIDGTREKGLYHHLKNEPHALFESELSGLATWFLQCLQINVSAGRYYCVESGGMGMGSLLMTQKKLGPFQ